MVEFKHETKRDISTKKEKKSKGSWLSKEDKEQRRKEDD